MKRKIASIFLALAMILSLIPGTVFAGEGTGDAPASLSDTIVDSGTFGEDGDNLTWSLSSNGTLTINGTGEMGYQTPWMSYRDSIKSLVVEEGVTTVGRSAFSGCNQLTSATLPTSLTEIGQSAFLGCFNLEKICLPDTLNAIGDNAFGSAWDTAFFFTGSEEQWNAVTIGSGNEPLENKKIHFNATYHTYDENGICTVCGYAGPNHTSHVMSVGYYYSEDGHWQVCIYCEKPMTETEAHVFDEDGICSVCGYARAGHTHKAAEYYGCDADGHWSICRFCGRQIGRVQAHDYAYSRCKVCGQYEADHVHSYAWLAEDSEHWQECEICYTAVNKGKHTFINNVCEECGLLDPSLVPESIAVSINQNKQMTTVLTFTNGSSRELTITGIDILKGDEKNFSGVIYTKEGVLLGGDYWLLSNEAGQYTIEYRLYTGAKVLGNFVDSREWVKLGELAKKQGIVAADCTYANGVWTVTGKAYDGQRAVMTLNDNLTVLNYTIGEDELVKASGIVTVSDAKAKPGKTVTVKVDLSANKGISNMRLQMSYPKGFTLESIQKGDALSTLFFTPPGKLTANPVNFVWDGTEADMSEGCILELTFRIADTVAVGEYSISLSYQKDDVLDGSLEGIDLALQSGTVSVVEFTRGDIDDDGVIGMKDLGALRKYFAGGYDTEKFVMEAADLDGDGVVTMKDLGVLRRYLAGGYDINLGE